MADSNFQKADQTSREFFEEMWSQGDPWELQCSAFEKQRYAHLLKTITGRRYTRVLEIGCGAGVFTRQLACISERVVGIDVSPTAINKAQADHCPPNVTFKAANIMEYDVRSGPPWDLVVLAETIYYLGWLYPFFNVGWLAHELHEATVPGGRLLLTNTSGCGDDHLLLPWLIQTYHDLFRNVGYQIEAEEVFRGEKDGMEIEVLTTMFKKENPA